MIIAIIFPLRKIRRALLIAPRTQTFGCDAFLGLLSTSNSLFKHFLRFRWCGSRWFFRRSGNHELMGKRTHNIDCEMVFFFFGQLLLPWFVLSFFCGNVFFFFILFFFFGRYLLFLFLFLFLFSVVFAFLEFNPTSFV